MVAVEKSCQAGTLNHENKLHKSFTRHLFYVPAIHRTSGLMSEYLIQSDNCLGRRKAAGFSHREKKIQNKYTAVDEQKAFKPESHIPFSTDAKENSQQENKQTQIP